MPLRKGSGSENGVLTLPMKPNAVLVQSVVVSERWRITADSAWRTSSGF